MTDPLEKNDPARLMKLLWRDSVDIPPKRGPKPALTIDAVVRAAIVIADAEGLGGLTVRRLASSLQKPAMTIYAYASGKVELVPLMLDMIHMEMARRAPATEGWRARLEAIMLDNRRLFEAHPWAAEVSLGRPVLGPGTMAKYDYELRAFDGLGLSDLQMDSALTHLLVVAASIARASIRQRAAEQDTAQSDQQWWADSAPLFELAFDPDQYPIAARVGSAAGAALDGAYDAEHAWNFAMERLLDGFQPLIERGGGN